MHAPQMSPDFAESNKTRQQKILENDCFFCFIKTGMTLLTTGKYQPLIISISRN
jgi:hypothetical protein